MKKLNLTVENHPFEGKDYKIVILDNSVILGGFDTALIVMENLFKEAIRLGDNISFNICTIGFGAAFHDLAVEKFGASFIKGTIMENMNFGKALEALKEGKIVRRAGWNGKGLSLILKRGIQAVDNSHESVQGVSIDLMDVGDYGITTRLPHIEIYYPDGVHCAWLASQTDMLANDWQEVLPEVA